MAEENLLVPLDEYLKAGLHIGTKFRTKFMQKFIYKVRSDGLSVLNVEDVNNRMLLAANMLSDFEPNEILVVCRRENGWKPAKLFSKLTGINVIAGRYPPGMLTNVELGNFREIKILLAVDPWPDRNAIKDAIRVGVPVIALADTNNEANNLDLVVPCNNKGKKSLGVVFYILAKEYMKSKGSIKKDEELGKTIEDFCVE